MSTVSETMLTWYPTRTELETGREFSRSVSVRTESREIPQPVQATVAESAADESITTETVAVTNEVVTPSPTLAQVVEKYQSVIFGYFKTRLFQKSEVEDLAQEVFVRYYTGQVDSDRVLDLETVRPWLLGIARNVLREHLRKLNSRREILWTEFCLELEEETPEEGLTGSDETIEDLRACVEDLGPTAQKAIRLKYHQDKSLKQISESLCRSEGAVKLLVFRARQALKRCLDLKTREREHQEDLAWL